MRRAILIVACLIGCDGAGPASILEPAPQGGGFCCPSETPMCGCYRTGGWVPTDNPQTCPPGICDSAPPYEVRIDEHGCELMIGSDHSCLPLLDAGVDATDASTIDGAIAPDATP